MARVIGGRRRRVGDESVRLATTAGALVAGVAAVFVGIQGVRSGIGTALVVAVLVVLVAPALVVAKLLLDRRLVGASASRRTQDTRALGERLAGLPDTWWVFPDAFFADTGVEFLVIGPGGLFAVEVFRWLARDTGTAFHEKVASELATRAQELRIVLTRMTGSREGLPVQPVYVSMEAEGLRIGDLVIHSAATDLYVLRGVIVATLDNLLPLLRVGGAEPGVGTRPLDPEVVQRLGQLLEQTGSK